MCIRDRNSTGSKKEKKAVVSAQLKKDIENSLEPDAKDAIINGYLSLLNKDYILRDELDLDLVSICLLYTSVSIGSHSTNTE